MVEGRWLKFGLITGEHLICDDCGRIIEGSGDREVGVIFCLISDESNEIPRAICGTCYSRLQGEVEGTK